MEDKQWENKRVGLGLAITFFGELISDSTSDRYFKQNLQIYTFSKH